MAAVLSWSPVVGFEASWNWGSIVDVYVPCSKYEDIGIEVETYGLDVATGIKFAMDGGLEQVSSAISNLLDVASIGGNQQHRGREAPLPLSVSMDPS